MSKDRDELREWYRQLRIKRKLKRETRRHPDDGELIVDDELREKLKNPKY